MGNYNVLITNPYGYTRHQFIENVSMDECKDWLEEYGPAPIGWQYQIINLHKKDRVYPDHILVQGFDPEGNFVDSVKCNDGNRISPKQAKKMLRSKGAIKFTREKIWSEEEPKEQANI